MLGLEIVRNYSIRNAKKGRFWCFGMVVNCNVTKGIFTSLR